MKCSAANIHKLLNFSQTGNVNLNLNEDEQKIVSALSQIGDKKYKLSFILSAFAGMYAAIKDESYEFEVDADKVSEYLSENDYWIESYEDYWDESDNFFNYINQVASTDDIKETIISNFYEGNFSSTMSSLLRDCSGSDQENYNPDAIPVETIIKGMQDDGFLDSLISGINRVHIVVNRNPYESRRKYGIDPNTFFSQGFYEKIGMPFNSRPSLSQGDLETFFEQLIDHLADIYADEIENIDIDNEIADVLKSDYEDSAKERWINDNKSEWLSSEVDSYIENNIQEFVRENVLLSKKYFGVDTNQEGAMHWRIKSFTQRVSTDPWIEFEGERGEKISVDESQPVSKLGVDEWIEAAEVLKDRATQYEIDDNHDDFMEIMNSYADTIKLVINSDPVLKEVFSDDSGPYSESLNEGSLLRQNEIFAESSSYMDREDAEKFMRDFSENSPERVGLIEDIRRRRIEQEEQDRIFRQRAQERARLEEEENKKSISEKESLRAKIKEEKEKYLLNPELIYKEFGEDGVRAAKEMGLFDKGFDYKSLINVGRRFPGYSATSNIIGDMANASSNVRYYSELIEPFNIVVHPKRSENDPSGMHLVFENGSPEGGINYHHGTLDRGETPENYYNFIGWVGGGIDFINKIMYVTEIQSDVTQKTYRMRDVDSSISGLNEEKNKIMQEMSSIESKISSFDSISYFNNKIKELEDKINSSSDEILKKKLTFAVEAIKKQMTSGIDPLQQDRQKLEKLRANLAEIEKQISSIEERKSTDKSPGLNRPHLSRFKSKIENKFEDWLEVFYNEIFRYCKNLEIKTLYLVSASSLHKLWTGWSTQETFEMFKQVYDEQASKHQMEKVKFNNDTWWKLDLGKKMPKYAKSWYKTIKLAQHDFSNINISDLLDQFRRGAISQTDLEKKIRERYSDFIKNNSSGHNIYIEKLKAFFKTHFEIMGGSPEFGHEDDYSKLEKIRSSVSAFMSTTGKDYLDDGGEDLKEPFRSILHRFLIQNYNYDMDLDELID